MVEKINASGGKATLTLFPECEHNCWDNVYVNKENFDWLLSYNKEINL